VPVFDVGTAARVAACATCNNETTTAAETARRKRRRLLAEAAGETIDPHLLDDISEVESWERDGGYLFDVVIVPTVRQVAERYRRSNRFRQGGIKSWGYFRDEIFAPPTPHEADPPRTGRAITTVGKLMRQYGLLPRRA
jgi:hypothetical protein